MDLRPTGHSLSTKSHSSQCIGSCPYCSCGCSFIVYSENNLVKDIYGHPADSVGMGSLCTKGLTYLQEIVNSEFRLRGYYLNKEPISRQELLRVLRENLIGKKIAFILTKQASAEDYLVASQIGEVFVDAPVVGFKTRTLDLKDWPRVKLIISIDAEPTLSDVMAMRFVVDAIEAGAKLICISARYESLCAKAHERELLNLGEMVRFLQRHLRLDGEIGKLLRAFRGGLVLFGAHLFLTPARAWFEYFLKKVREMGANYAIVGDIVRFEAREIGELFLNLEKFDAIVSIGNGFRYFSDEELELISKKFSLSFSAVPDFSINVSNVGVGLSLVPERGFSAFRGGLREGIYSNRCIASPSGCEEPWRLLSEVFEIKSLGELKLQDAKALNKEEPKGFLEAKRWIYYLGGLCEELGHWGYWTHGLEPTQRLILPKGESFTNPKLESIEKVHSANIAKGAVFISPEFDEYQPFFAGIRPGSFQGRPFYLVEALT
ncbi:MAG: hypothetical protein NZL90_00110 [Aquificaceae bacterium]|nr:hypothetical protein [Aquificaceae bacterium]MDW8236898.1 hypothetical protein [Aquificaceae bacterium]